MESVIVSLLGNFSVSFMKSFLIDPLNSLIDPNIKSKSKEKLQVELLLHLLYDACSKSSCTFVSVPVCECT